MSGLIAVAGAGLAVIGLFVLVAGFLPGPEPLPRRQGGLATRLRSRWDAWPRPHRIRAAIGLLAGLVTTVLTGFVPALLLVPALLVVLPELLASPPNHELAMLEALDRWIRAVTASVGIGKSVPDALRATSSQAPKLLAEPIKTLVTRLDDRWPVRDAMHAMADQLDHPDADAVLAALILVGERGGVGASTTLRALSDGLQDRLRATREIDAERAKPQIVVRQVTVITLAALGGGLILAPGYFAAFLTAPGQLLMAMLGTAYLGSLWALRSLATPRRRDRVLVRAAVPGRGGEYRHA